MQYIHKLLWYYSEKWKKYLERCRYTGTVLLDHTLGWLETSEKILFT